MTKLKLGHVETDKVIRVSIKLAPPVYRNLLAYAEALAAATHQEVLKPDKIIPAMVEQFMATDRGFARVRNQTSGRPKLQKPS
jgi:hypothetical protein